ncbi:MAG: peptide-methionine (S)-S-oxide reductase MsrA [Opitutaceae bacterium]|nr:peptide-methionine (S)-S-oxide reductase MsrA [Opitutaceae bacterium]
MKRAILLLAASAALFFMSQSHVQAETVNSSSKSQFATFGGGCFWCMQAVFERVPGVKNVVCGYSGGHVDQPSYEQVCSHKTGHAEVVQIEFEPAEVSYGHLLNVFWEAHDPTSLNRQGDDEGPQYRSVVFYHDETQHQAVLKAKAGEQQNLTRPIVTEIVPLKKFWPAEEYHQHYFEKNPSAGYCAFVIRPKVAKLQKEGVIAK